MFKWLFPASDPPVTDSHDTWQELVEWWRMRNREIDQCSVNETESLRNDELRQRIAPFLAQLFPHVVACDYCQWPIYLIRHHHTKIADHSEVWVMCDYCWSYLRSYGQQKLIRELYHRRREKSWPHITREQLDAAIDCDFGPPRQLQCHVEHPRGEICLPPLEMEPKT